MAPADVTIERASPRDVNEIVSAYEWLHAEPGRRPAQWNEERASAAVRRTLDSPTSCLFVARAESNIVGFVTVYLEFESVRFGVGVWVEDLAVDPAHRSRGIGKALLDQAKEWARARGATHLGLESGERRVDAHRFYERERPTARARAFSWAL